MTVKNPLKKIKLTAKDSRGDESTTLFFVRVSWAVVVFKFVIAGMSLPYVGEMPPMSAVDFGIAVTAILSIWLGREWSNKKHAMNYPVVGSGRE